MEDYKEGELKVEGRTDDDSLAINDLQQMINAFIQEFTNSQSIENLSAILNDLIIFFKANTKLECQEVIQQARFYTCLEDALIHFQNNPIFETILRLIVYMTTNDYEDGNHFQNFRLFEIISQHLSNKKLFHTIINIYSNLIASNQVFIPSFFHCLSKYQTNLQNLTGANLDNPLGAASILQLCVVLMQSEMNFPNKNQYFRDMLNALFMILKSDVQIKQRQNIFYVIERILSSSELITQEYAVDNSLIEFFLGFLSDDNDMVVYYCLGILQNISLNEKCQYLFNLGQFVQLLQRPNSEIQRKISICIANLLVNFRLIFLNSLDLNAKMGEILQYMEIASFESKVCILKTFDNIFMQINTTQKLDFINAGLKAMLPFFAELNDEGPAGIAFLDLLFRMLQAIENLDIQDCVDFMQFLEENEILSLLDDYEDSENMAILSKCELIRGKIANISMRVEQQNN